jgi:hypothetical protein
VAAHGPAPEYFHDPATELSWGDCRIYQNGGSHRKLPFLPAGVSDPVRAPSGTRGYSKDVSFDGPIFLVADGVAVGGLDLEGAAVLMSLDTPDEVGELATLEAKISALGRRGAVAVVVFPLDARAPFPRLDPESLTDLRGLVPVIAVTLSAAADILAASTPIAESLLEDWTERGIPPSPQALPSRLRCTYDGRFERHATPHFEIRYRDSAFSGEEIDELARVNEESVSVLLGIFEGLGLEWTPFTTTYFRGFDSKVFYVRHWGDALATAAGSFLVYRGAPDLGLIVHENAHVLFERNWGESSSFLVEGLAKYAEAEATDPEDNHRRTLAYRRAGSWFALAEMVDFQIGLPGLETEVGYPAAGSFVGYLVETHGLSPLREIWRAQATAAERKRPLAGWERVYGATLDELEAAWLSWLGKPREE